MSRLENGLKGAMLIQSFNFSSWHPKMQHCILRIFVCLPKSLSFCPLVVPVCLPVSWSNHLPDSCLTGLLICPLSTSVLSLCQCVAQSGRQVSLLNLSVCWSLQSVYPTVWPPWSTRTSLSGCLSVGCLHGLSNSVLSVCQCFTPWGRLVSLLNLSAC